MPTMHRCGMGRNRRPYQPGMIFHLISRTHQGEPWFTPDLRTEIIGLIRGLIPRTDARLLAYAVMPNHLHIIVQQGRTELGRVMQPLLRRVALRVHREHGITGSVVHERYRSWPCATPDYVRDVVVYAHLNPWRAGLCGDDLAYEWTSHGAYLPGADPEGYGIRPTTQLHVLQLFADDERRSRDELHELYAAWIEWRMRADTHLAALDSGAGLATPPPARPSNLADRYARVLGGGGDGGEVRTVGLEANAQYDAAGGMPLPDLRDFVLAQIDLLAPGLSIALLRGSRCKRPIVRARNQIIKAAADRGFRTGVIARFFDISPQSVSRVRYAGRT